MACWIGCWAAAVAVVVTLAAVVVKYHVLVNIILEEIVIRMDLYFL